VLAKKHSQTIGKNIEQTRISLPGRRRPNPELGLEDELAPEAKILLEDGGGRPAGGGQAGVEVNTKRRRWQACSIICTGSKKLAR
jgi:hypothetical protein